MQGCLTDSFLIPVLAIFSFSDLVISIGMMALGSESSKMTKWKKRCATRSRPPTMCHCLQRMMFCDLSST